ncbi:MAG: alkaline phosphatase D family protein [Gammaproteobacteria bacterium]|nr:alkaline phosphatase D family protein [Gammaproteobacteria bacterium]
MQTAASGLVLLVCLAGCTGTPPLMPERILATHGVASGDASSDSVVIWSRGSAAGRMHVRLNESAHDQRIYTTTVRAADDFTGKVLVAGLQPNREYQYTVWFSDSDEAPGDIENGRFRTAPDAASPASLHFAWGGDLAGQNVCRDATEGFPVFRAVNKLELDFFIGLGDMIYADGICKPTGRYGNSQVAGEFIQSADLDNYRAHWKYNREDDAFRQLLAGTSYLAVWDDHEVVNDFGPQQDTRDAPPYSLAVHLMPIGLRAFLDYNPVAGNSDDPGQLYRSVRWGKHLELILLDTRQYRDSNLAPDDGVQPKTMLGAAQLQWFRNTVADSEATWKIIVSSVPLSIPTGFPPEKGRDGWADFDQNRGFERELRDIFGFLRQQKLRNFLFITTDVHFAAAFRYRPFADDPAFQVYEVATGPLNAGLFPNRDFDTSLGTEQLFFFGPASPDTVGDYRQARRWMNFGAVSIDANGELYVSVIDVDGTPVYKLHLSP